MGLTSTTLLVLSAFMTLSLPVAVLLTWHLQRGPRAVKAAQRLGLVLVAQGFAVLLTFVAVNDQYLFFASWQDLLGAPSAPGLITSVGGSALANPSGGVTVNRSTSQLTAGGRLITETVHGNHSGITGRVLIHLPAGYATSTRSYPVVELLAGWHNAPRTWIRNLHVLEAMRTQERTGALEPVITVIPDINVATPRDVECTNVPHGPQAETWLASDIHDLVLSQYRALAGARNWALMGYSTGGYCAAKLALHKPQWYGTAVVIAGYFEAIKDHTTGDLWGGNRALRDTNSPLWLVTHHRPPPIDLLAFASRQDNESYLSTNRFLNAARTPMKTFRLIAPRGGHNFKALSQDLPEMLDWLGGHLSTSGCSTAPTIWPRGNCQVE